MTGPRRSLGKIVDPGTQVADRYEIVRLVGEGAMARVYEENDLLNDLRDHSDDSVAFRWLAMARSYQNNGLLTRDEAPSEPSTLSVAAQSQ